MPQTLPHATAISICAYSNYDDILVAWKPDGAIADCRGFKLERQLKGAGGTTTEIVENRLGFAADKPKSGEHRPSDVWPFQRFNWNDFVHDGTRQARYRVTAMTGSAGALTSGLASDWSNWTKTTPDCGDGFSAYFNRGLVLSQFVARYMRDHHLNASDFKKTLKNGGDAPFRTFLEGALGARMRQILADGAKKTTLYAALYEIDDAELEDGLVAVGQRLNLVLANGSDKAGDGNADARAKLNDAGIATTDRLLKSKGLGHNKFVVLAPQNTPAAVWTGSTNWSTTGLCTQINNGLLIEDPALAGHYKAQWDRLKAASPPETDPAGFPPALVAANDAPHTFAIGSAEATVQFTRTSDGRDMDMLRELINEAQASVLFLMFMPGPSGLHLEAAKRAKDGLYVRGVVSSLGNTSDDNQRSFLDVSLIGASAALAKKRRFDVSQPQGLSKLGGWIAEVTRGTFLSQIGHAIVHSKVLVIDHQTDSPIIVTGSHNFSAAASQKNDENLLVIRGHKKLAEAYAVNVMSVYQHYRYRSYVKDALDSGQTPWSYLDDDDRWLSQELVSKASEISFWAPDGAAASRG